MMRLAPALHYARNNIRAQPLGVGVRRRERDVAIRPDEIEGRAQETGAPTGMWEWFSPSRGRTVTSQPKTRPDPDPPDDWVLLTDVEPDARPD